MTNEVSLVGAAPVYDSKMHERAYLLWAETGNMSKVARTLGIAPMTLYRWKDADFRCGQNCAWHNYDVLDQATKRANAARNELLNAGVNDPVQLDLAMREQVELSGQKIARTSKDAKGGDYPSMELIRRNDAVIGDLEFLYAKAMFLATGQAIRPEHVVLDANGGEIDYAALYEKGLKFRDLEQATNCLLKLRQEIASLHDSGGAKVSLEQITTTKRVTLTLEQLTQMREQLLEVRSETGQGVPDLPATTDEATTDDQ